MKKIVSILLAVSMILALTGCGKNSGNNGGNNSRRADCPNGGRHGSNPASHGSNPASYGTVPGSAQRTAGGRQL